MTVRKQITARWTAVPNTEGLKVRQATPAGTEFTLVVTEIKYRKKFGWTVSTPTHTHTGPRCNTQKRAQLNALQYARRLHSTN